MHTVELIKVFYINFFLVLNESKTFTMIIQRFFLLLFFSGFAFANRDDAYRYDEEEYMCCTCEVDDVDMQPKNIIEKEVIIHVDFLPDTAQKTYNRFVNPI